MKTTKSVYEAVVLKNYALAERFFHLTLEFDGKAAAAFKDTLPGQFLEIDLSTLGLPQTAKIPADLADRATRQIILRRPFSFRDITVMQSGKVRAEILYCVLGPATLRMTTLSEGVSVSVIGPLGNGFSVAKDKKIALLVAGGMGAPPLQHLAALLKVAYQDTHVVAFAGAQNYKALPFTLLIDNKEGLFLQEFSRLRVESHIATDDGSAGFHGYVTDCVEKWFKEHKPVPSDIMIYACGPEPMLASVAKLAASNDIECQVSMERMMACGIGLCQSCVVPVKDEGKEEVYRLCCKDGPIFNSKEIIFE